MCDESADVSREEETLLASLTSFSCVSASKDFFFLFLLLKAAGDCTGDFTGESSEASAVAGVVCRASTGAGGENVAEAGGSAVGDCSFALEMELALVIALASWVVASELEQQQQQQELGLEWMVA